MFNKYEIDRIKKHIGLHDQVFLFGEAYPPDERKLITRVKHLEEDLALLLDYLKLTIETVPTHNIVRKVKREA